MKSLFIDGLVSLVEIDDLWSSETNGAAWGQIDDDGGVLDS